MFEKLKSASLAINIGVVGVVVLLITLEIISRLLEPAFGLDKFIVKAPPTQSWVKLARASIPFEQLPKSPPLDGFDWAEDFVRVHDALNASSEHPQGLRYEPFSLWRHWPVATKYVTYEKNGYRRTTNPPPVPGERPFRVYVFGASLINGAGIIRDQDTIPSVIAQELSLRYGRRNIQVQTLAVGGFNQSNSMVLLSHILRDPNWEKPDLVILYDGTNDITQKAIFREPHMNFRAFSDIAMPGRPNDFFEYLINEFYERSALARLVGNRGILQARSIFFKEGYNTALSDLSPDEAVQFVADSFVRNYMHLEVLSRGYDFQFLMVLHPSLMTRQSPPENEAIMLKYAKEDWPEFPRILDQGYASIKRDFSNRTRFPNFVDLTSVMDQVDRAVYVDPVHVSPAGTQVIGAALARIIEERFGAKM